MKRASAIKVVLSCTGLIGGEKRQKKQNHSNFIFSSEIRIFNIGGPVNQLIKKKAYDMFQVNQTLPFKACFSSLPSWSVKHIDNS
jgi:hypothetical protein